jgi:hypothetical protein
VTVEAVELYAGVGVPHPHRRVVAAGDDAGTVAVYRPSAPAGVAVEAVELCGSASPHRNASLLPETMRVPSLLYPTDNAAGVTVEAVSCTPV